MNAAVPYPIVIARRLAGFVFIMSLVVVLVGLAFAANWFLNRPVKIAVPAASAAATLSSRTSPATTTPPRTPSPSPTRVSRAERERDALDQLEEQAASDLAITSFYGDWVAQLSSKYVGVKDPRQVTESGKHTFKAVDILAEHKKLRNRFTSEGYEVRLLRGEDFDPYKTHDGDTFWYTFALGLFGSKAEVKDFCRSSYPGLSGERLLNKCLPRTLKQ